MFKMSDQDTYIFKIIAILYISIIALQILSMIIFRCKVFQKANEKWWKALIPFYNQYIELKIAKKNELFRRIYLILYIMVIGVLAFFIILSLSDVFGFEISFGEAIGDFENLIITQAINLLLGIGPYILLVMNIFKYIGLVRSFNLNGAFAIGLTFTPGIFYPILALGKNQYIENRCSRNNNSKYIKNYYDNQYPLNYDNNRPPKYPLQQIKADIQNQYTENTDIENDLDPNLYR